MVLVGSTKWEMLPYWQNTFQTPWSVFFLRNSWIQKLLASAAWNVCNEIYHSKSKNAVMRLAAGSANIITLHWILNERFTFLHSRVRKWLQTRHLFTKESEHHIIEYAKRLKMLEQEKSDVKLLLSLFFFAYYCIHFCPPIFALIHNDTGSFLST